jgi:signal transduction histidine kinase
MWHKRRAIEPTGSGLAKRDDLRSQPPSQGDLAQLLTVTGQELARSQDASGNPVIFRVTVEGERQELDSLLQDDAHRIARELLRNAFRHARASQIEAEIRYDYAQLRVRIRDNGKGIEPETLTAGRAGHWGLLGMRERAKRIGARLDFWSGAGAGTEVELSVPSSMAYRVAPTGWRFPLFRKKKANS